MLRTPFLCVLLLAFLGAPASRADGLFRHAGLKKHPVTSRALKRKILIQALRPDLQIQQVGFDQVQTPAFDYPKVYVLVRNAGQVPAGLFYVSVLYSRDGKPQAGVVSLAGGLAPGESEMVQIDLSPQGGGLSQYHELTVKVDHAFSASEPYGNVLESNEQNNVWGPIGVWL